MRYWKLRVGRIYSKWETILTIALARRSLPWRPISSSTAVGTFQRQSSERTHALHSALLPPCMESECHPWNQIGAVWRYESLYSWGWSRVPEIS